MTETFIALMFGHVLADYVFQTRALIAAKDKPWGLPMHGVIVLVTAWAAVGFAFEPALLALAGTHVLIDWTKRAFGDTLIPYLADQAAHVASIAVIAAVWPGLWAAGYWPGMAPLVQPIFLILTGAVFATRAGEFTVSKLMAQFPDLTLPDGSAPGAGRMIGNLERLLVYVFLLLDQPTATAILVAAKSILRFGSVGGDRRASEYVLIGTLASITWAILVALAVKSLM